MEPSQQSVNSFRPCTTGSNTEDPSQTPLESNPTPGIHHIHSKPPVHSTLYPVPPCPGSTDTNTTPATCSPGIAETDYGYLTCVFHQMSPFGSLTKTCNPPNASGNDTRQVQYILYAKRVSYCSHVLRRPIPSAIPQIPCYNIAHPPPDPRQLRDSLGYMRCRVFLGRIFFLLFFLF